MPLITLQNFDCGLLGERDLHVEFRITERDVLQIQRISCDIGEIENIPPFGMDVIEDECYAYDRGEGLQERIEEMIDRRKAA